MDKIKVTNFDELCVLNLKRKRKNKLNHIRELNGKQRAREIERVTERVRFASCQIEFKERKYVQM